MNEKNEKYPQIVIGTDGICQVFVCKDVEVKFNSAESVNNFFKHKNVSIIGKKANRIRENHEGQMAIELLYEMTK